jgi:hypothetical protein
LIVLAKEILPMANTTHHLKSDLKHRKNQPQQPKAAPVERVTQGERNKPEQKTDPSRPARGDIEEGFDAPGSQRPPADS